MSVLTQDPANSESEVAVMDMEETVFFEQNPPDSNSSEGPQSSAPAAEPTGAYDRGRAQGPDVMVAATPPPNLQSNRYTYSSGSRPLDGYTIKRAIGRGGFGEVYYATSDSGKEVALKLIVRNLEVESRGVKQCMNLKCANLLSIHDLRSNDAGESFVIMEYVAGPSLSSVLSRYPEGMPLAEVRAWMRGLVEGVAYLHDHGIVHRDLKPANLFMEEGVVKIGDYGLAKLITPSAGTGHSESIGTCHYMAPEIASGKYNKPIDIYAMGVILFEMMTGRVPFEGETVHEVIMKHLTSRADVSMLSEPFRTIVAKALAKDPANRPKSVYDLLPADDVPKTPNVRFIGDGKTSPRLPEAGEAVKVDVNVNGAANPRGNPPKPAEEIHRIDAEDSVFYIGPDTKPPTPNPANPRGLINDRLRANWDAIRQDVVRAKANWRANLAPANPKGKVRQASYRTPQPQAAPRPQPVVAPLPLPVPVEIPTRPDLPSFRVRVAELASSMLWSTPIAALLAFPLGIFMGADPSTEPERISFLFGMSLLGTWMNLATVRLLEGLTLDSTSSKLIKIGGGMLVGLVGAAYSRLIDVGDLAKLNGVFSRPFSDHGLPVPLTFVIFFGVVALLGNLPGYARRDRRSRIRIFPLFKVALVAMIVGIPLAFPQPWGVAIAVLTAVVTQLISPWSSQAAKYARYSAKQAKLAAKRQAA